MKKKNPTKRNLFAELMEGVDAMKAQREGKVTLRTHAVALPKIEEAPGAEFFVAAREKFNVSRAVWANMLRVSPRTVEKWEQGGQVSPLAATYVELVTQYPDTIERLQTLPRRVPRSSLSMRLTSATRSSAARGRSRKRVPVTESSLRHSAKGR
jgi:putative transcriptional regulator